MKITFISHTADSGIFRVGSHHLARELSLRGHDVAHISTPFSLTHRLLGRGGDARRELASNGPRRDAVGVLHAVPNVLFPMSVLRNAASMRQIVLQLDCQGSDFFVIDQPLMGAIAEVFPDVRSVYRPTDEYPSGPYARRQRRLLRRVVGVVATSGRVLESLPEFGPLPTMILENGVEAQLFSGAPFGVSDRCGFVYVGALDERFDWDAVRVLSAAFPSEPINIYGPSGVNPGPLPSNVLVHGPVPYSQLPGVLRAGRVGLLPLSASTRNEGRSPMKLYEYSAAGLSVLARSTESLRAAASAERADQLFLYGEIDHGLVAKARSALEYVPDPEAALSLARLHDWSRNALGLEQFLEALNT